MNKTDWIEYFEAILAIKMLKSIKTLSSFLICLKRAVHSGQTTWILMLSMLILKKVVLVSINLVTKH